MDNEPDMARVEPFMPLTPVPRRRLIGRMVVAPLLWLIAVVTAAITVNRTDAIELGLLIASGSAALAAVVLALIRAGRERERARSAPGG